MGSQRHSEGSYATVRSVTTSGIPGTHPPVTINVSALLGAIACVEGASAHRHRASDLGQSHPWKSLSGQAPPSLYRFESDGEYDHPRRCEL